MKKIFSILLLLHISLIAFAQQDSCLMTLNYTPANCYNPTPSQAIINLYAQDGTTLLDQTVANYTGGVLASISNINGLINWNGTLNPGSWSTYWIKSVYGQFIATSEIIDDCNGAYTSPGPVKSEAFKNAEDLSKLCISGYSVDSSEVLLEHVTPSGIVQPISIKFPCQDIVFQDEDGNTHVGNTCDPILLHRDFHVNQGNQLTIGISGAEYGGTGELNGITNDHLSSVTTSQNSSALDRWSSVISTNIGGVFGPRSLLAGSFNSQLSGETVFGGAIQGTQISGNIATGIALLNSLISGDRSGGAASTDLEIVGIESWGQSSDAVTIAGNNSSSSASVTSNINSNFSSIEASQQVNINSVASKHFVAASANVDIMGTGGSNYSIGSSSAIKLGGVAAGVLSTTRTQNDGVTSVVVSSPDALIATGHLNTVVLGNVDATPIIPDVTNSGHVHTSLLHINNTTNTVTSATSVLTQDITDQGEIKSISTTDLGISSSIDLKENFTDVDYDVLVDFILNSDVFYYNYKTDELVNKKVELEKSLLELSNKDYSSYVKSNFKKFEDKRNQLIDNKSKKENDIQLKIDSLTKKIEDPTAVSKYSSILKNTSKLVSLRNKVADVYDDLINGINLKDVRKELEFKRAELEKAKSDQVNHLNFELNKVNDQIKNPPKRLGISAEQFAELGLSNSKEVPISMWLGFLHALTQYQQVQLGKFAKEIEELKKK